MAGATKPSIQVWDPWVRIGHWLLVASIAATWFTRHSPGRWHEWLGYTALAIVSLRLVWGFASRGFAHFESFIRSPRLTFAYARALLHCREARYVGHNPLGGWMIVFLLGASALVCTSGWLYTTDRYWGMPWVERLHSLSSDLLLGLIALHVCGVAFTSIRNRENLAGSMIHGRKRPQDRED